MLTVETEVNRVNINRLAARERERPMPLIESARFPGKREQSE